MKKSLYLIVALPMIFILAACASLKLPGSQPAAGASGNANATDTGGQRGPGGFANFASQPVENKLAIGTLKLEGTPNAVTQKEAADLLPLWKAVKSLSASNTTSPDEVTALYKQIEDTMTPAQVTAIKNLSMQQSDFTALMQQYGIQFNQGGFGNLSPSQQATRIAQFRAQGGGAGGAGGNGGVRVGGGGFGGGGNFGGGNGGTGGNTNGQPSVQRTPNPARRNAGGMNFLFVDPVIKLLTQRAG